MRDGRDSLIINHLIKFNDFIVRTTKRTTKYFNYIYVIDEHRKYFYYLVFGVTFLTFGLVQDYIRPNYEAKNSHNYFLGVIINFLPGIGLSKLM